MFSFLFSSPALSPLPEEPTKGVYSEPHFPAVLPGPHQGLHTAESGGRGASTPYTSEPAGVGWLNEGVRIMFCLYMTEMGLNAM